MAENTTPSFRLTSLRGAVFQEKNSAAVNAGAEDGAGGLCRFGMSRTVRVRDDEKVLVVSRTD